MRLSSATAPTYSKKNFGQEFDYRPECGCGRGAIPAQEVPFGDVELGLATLLGLVGDRKELLRRELAEIEPDDRTRPVVAFQPRGVRLELRRAVLARALARKVAKIMVEAFASSSFARSRASAAALKSPWLKAVRPRCW